MNCLAPPSGPTQDSTLRAWLELAISAAQSAGKLILEGSATPVVVESTRRDIKLDIDLRAETAIVNILKTSGLPILCEEQGWIGVPETTYWVVDGIDGTVNFHYGLPFAAVSVALIIDYSPYIGVVFDFGRNEMFAGGIGLGVTLNGSPIGPSLVSTVDGALLLTALATKGAFDFVALERFGRRLGRWKKVRMLGSAALSLAYVASGRADACEIQGIMAWDVMAGIALVRSAGGEVAWNELGDSVVDVFASNGTLTLRDIQDE